MHDLGNQRQRLDRACTDAWSHEQVGKIYRAALGGGGKGGMKAAHLHVAGRDIVMGGHAQVFDYAVGSAVHELDLSVA